MYNRTSKQKIGTLTNERLVNSHFLTTTNWKTSSECNRNYNTAIFTSTIKEKPKNDGNCSLSNECVWSDQYFCEPLLEIHLTLRVTTFNCHARQSQEEQKSPNSSSKWSMYYTYSPQRYTLETKLLNHVFIKKPSSMGVFNITTIQLHETYP